MFNCTGSLKLNKLLSNLALHFKCIKGNVDFVKEKKVCHITILAGLSLVAPGAEACIVADADPCVFARRVALRFGVENEPDRDPSGRVRARGANAEKSHQGGQQHRRTETHETHGWFLFCLSSGEREEQTDRRPAEMEENKHRDLSARRPRCCCCCCYTHGGYNRGSAGGVSWRGGLAGLEIQSVR